MSIKDQFYQAPSKDRKAIIIATIVVILFIGGALITLAKAYDDKELQPWGRTNGDFVHLVERANGDDSTLDPTDIQVEYYVGLAKQACTDLTSQRNIDFYHSITKSSRDRVIITGGILVICPELQERAIEYGLTESDYEKFPLK